MRLYLQLFLYFWFGFYFLNQPLDKTNMKSMTFQQIHEITQPYCIHGNQFYGNLSNIIIFLRQFNTMIDVNHVGTSKWFKVTSTNIWLN